MMFCRFLKLEEVGIVNYLLKRKNIEQGTDTFGHAFEHLLMQEIIAYMSYNLSDEKLSYWRTSGGYEVDCIIGQGRVAIEFKSSNEIQSRQTKGLKAFQEEYPQCRAVIVSMDKNRRNLNNIEIIPAIEFLTDLWNGKIV
jgi:predicted AAA+ superfamily ATPase